MLARSSPKAAGQPGDRLETGWRPAEDRLKTGAKLCAQSEVIVYTTMTNVNLTVSTTTGRDLGLVRLIAWGERHGCGHRDLGKGQREVGPRTPSIAVTRKRTRSKPSRTRSQRA
jgi:hypothetical protein